MKLLKACCRQPGNNLLRAGNITLVGTICNKPDEVVNLVTILLQDANILFQIYQTTGNKQCEPTLILP